MIAISLLFMKIIFICIIRASITKNELLKIAIWNANSGLELKEVCRSEKMDILILDGLQVQVKGRSHCLKMLQLGSSQNRFKPFPHIHLFTKEKKKGAVYAEYFDVSELGRALESCKQSNVKIFIQVKMRKNLKLTRRKTILLSSILWNSFFYNGDYYDRPFGHEIVFDGIHLSFERETLNLSRNLINRMNEMAQNEGREISFSSESGNLNNALMESNFIIVPQDSITAKTAPTEVPFAILTTDENSKKIEQFRNCKMFRGKAKKLCKTSRLASLKRLMSRNPKNLTSGPSIFAILLIVGLFIIFLLISFYVFKWTTTKKSSAKSVEVE